MEDVYVIDWDKYLLDGGEDSLHENTLLDLSKLNAVAYSCSVMSSMSREVEAQDFIYWLNQYDERVEMYDQFMPSKCDNEEQHLDNLRSFLDSLDSLNAMEMEDFIFSLPIVPATYEESFWINIIDIVHTMNVIVHNHNARNSKKRV